MREACREAELAWTQSALGKAFNVSAPMAWNYMNGEKKPSMNKAIEIASRLNVCTEWLLSGRGPKRPDDALDMKGVPEDVKASVKTILRSFKSPPDRPT